MRGRGRGMRWRGGQQQMKAPPPPPITPSDLNQFKMEEEAAAAAQDDANGVDLHDPAEDLQEDKDEEMAYEGKEEEHQEGGEGEEGEGNEEDQEMKGNKRTWGAFKGSKNKRKKPAGLKNRRIKKYAHPKNAVMCLNELNPGTRYVCEQEGTISQPCCMSVEVNGQKYRGYGSSKQLAKQAAAEAALISYVKPPVASSEGPEKDETPWATLVSFAMFKLFNDWREGRVGMCPPQTQPFGTAVAPDMKSMFPSGAAAGNGAAAESNNPAVSYLENIGAHLDGRSGPVHPSPAVATSAPGTDKGDPKVLPKPAKQIPEGAASMHPVMLLNQMKPGLTYDIKESMHDNKPFFVVTSVLDDQEFTGEGSNVKKAKLALARAAILGLYGVESSFEG